MIVYRDQRSRADPHRLLLQLKTAANRWCTTAPDHADAVELIIETGVLESAVADALFPERDGIHPLAQSLRQASIAAGHVLWHTWHGREAEAGQWGARLALSLREVPAHQLPRTVEVSVPEGYAYYAVYPEMYVEAAKQFYANVRPSNAVCLGIRSIGSSLSAVVTAGLEEQGCSVKAFTLRPRGHPFSRHPRLSGELAALLRDPSGTYFLLIDEGPGISGSSLGGLAALLQGWGIDNNHIVLFPSWQTDGAHLVSAEAREQWPRHPQFTASFEEVWINSGRLGAAFPGSVRDMSAGDWRQEVYQDIRDYPAVHPQHERRKYLLTTPGSSQGSQLLSFAGLGRSPAKRVERLARLADAGFTVAPDRLTHGFLLRPFVTGIPASSRQADVDLVERAAAYLAHLSREHAAEPSVNDESLREMITVNLAEGLELPAGAKLGDVLPTGGWAERPVALDGRMLAHEWVRTPNGTLKLDAMDHHDDHFFPGCQDIAWDVAAAAFELNLDMQSRTHLVEQYRRLSGDRGITRRLHHYAIAYLSFRLGYTSMAATALGQTADGARFSVQVQRYVQMLMSELKASTERWHG
jgi:hypothetical protein